MSETKIEFWDDDKDYGGLITYDVDFNDPPPELLPEVQAWIAEHPGVHEVQSEDILAIALSFPSEETKDAFHQKWAGY
jgi:hypothetical protein